MAAKKPEEKPATEKLSTLEKAKATLAKMVQKEKDKKELDEVRNKIKERRAAKKK